MKNVFYSFSHNLAFWHIQTGNHGGKDAIFWVMMGLGDAKKAFFTSKFFKIVLFSPEFQSICHFLNKQTKISITIVLKQANLCKFI